MARIYPLFSSSKGNCIYLGDNKNGILIDCGVSCKNVSNSLTVNGIPRDSVRAVFVTHTHTDHISGLNAFMKKVKVPLYAHKENIERMLRDGKIPETADCRELEDIVIVAGFTVEHFATSHDCKPSCGYKVTFPDGKTAAVCTDLGFVSNEVRNSLLGCKLVLIESNYDPERLRRCYYPDILKDRIAGREGHLSNPDCAAFLKELAENGTTHFILGHLSEESNTPELAEYTAKNALLPLECGRDYLLYVARPSGGTAIAF